MSTTALKIIALVLMLVDHIGQFIPGMPVWLHWLGRVSAPLFFFCAAWGLYYTHDRKRYLVRLYCFGAGMGVLGAVCSLFAKSESLYVTNNIFVALFSSAVICTIIDTWRADRARGIKCLLLYLFLQVAGGALCVVLMPVIPLPSPVNILFTGALTANALFCEGGPLFVLLGVALYLCKGRRVKLAVVYCLYCLLLWPASWEAALMVDYQWMMIAALPLMLLYNGHKGPGLNKYFFYIFYPVHIVALYAVGNFFL